MIVVSTALPTCHDEDIILTVNEFLLIMLDWRRLDITEKRQELQDVIEWELANVTNFNDQQMTSFLSLVVKFVFEFKQNLPVEFIRTLLDLKVNNNFCYCNQFTNFCEI